MMVMMPRRTMKKRRMVMRILMLMLMPSPLQVQPKKTLSLTPATF